jgi:hypothetical protein
MIAGRVIDGATGAPVGAAVVAIAGRGLPAAQAPTRVQAGADGQFFFRDLAGGSYSVTATKPGWIAGAYGRRRPGGGTLPIDLAAGERRGNVTILLWRHAIISGRVTDDAGDPLVDVDVRVAQQQFIAGRQHSSFAGRTRTDDRGVFRFSALSPGEYLVVVPANITSEPAGFAGAIRAAGETPRAYYQTMTALGTAPMTFDRAQVAAGTTDSLIASLLALPGTPGDEGAWLTYPTTFFPSTTSIASATPIRAVSGHDTSGIEVVLRFAPTYQIAGTLRGPDGPAAYHAIHLLPAESADLPLYDVATAVTDAAGAFTFFGVPTGQYVARVVRTPYPTMEGAELGLAGGTGAVPMVATFFRSRPAVESATVPTEPLLYADYPVTVTDRHLRDLSIVMKAGPRVRGRAEFEGKAPRPTAAQWRELRVALDSANGRSTAQMTPGLFGDDGEFVTSSTWPGRYLLRVLVPPVSPWRFKSATHQGRDLADTPFDFTTDLDSVIVTFTDKPASLTGTVTGANGSPGVGHAVVLFPVSPSTWTDYGRPSRRVRLSPTSTTGTFSIPAPPEGDYFLIAIPDEQAADWENPAILKKLSGIAERIQVRADQSASYALTARRVPQ